MKINKILAISLIAVMAISSIIGTISAKTNDNYDDSVNVGRYWSFWEDLFFGALLVYDYNISFYDISKNYIGGESDTECKDSHHATIPDNAVWYKVSMRLSTWDEDYHLTTDYIRAFYVSTGQKNTVDGQGYKNTGIFTFKSYDAPFGETGGWLLSYALESDVGRVISGWEKADGESGVLKNHTQ